ncbi:Protein UPSTREAM OF FLC [Cucurbita argyrosperma subsp. argyrosperma]|uniref:Protein UPSTREAM OF FLC-like n=1 Tax=Cucurbita moschata TaxID=3662 RepID=A0A6J1G949_CUCMO|nr:protein UPSTREAM OF FLC-like [Cucurbita moschata]XP_022948403.1 protein UPSTREAM OF FLC-like [Cucurbita moschata]KAG7036898.1 Protein UPSTREAM OF FLC [Cucurbita argyrosperma subsp. argyrosperma]
MAVASRPTLTDLQIPKLWKHHRDISPERTKVWTEPKLRSDRRVPVVYYLSRNGHLEHPHFMEVPLSSSEGLYLRDVINRLNLLRGNGMASAYSWSSKRSYKNGFVWHDLSENDFIYPLHGKEYVLKGSELLHSSLDSRVQGSVSSRSLRPPEIHKLVGEESDSPILSRRLNQSWSSVDFHEYKVYKTDSSSDSSAKAAAADASTQTDEKHRRRRRVGREEEKEEKETEEVNGESNSTPSTELSREEISPPPSDYSPETLESLMKADGRLIISEAVNTNRTTESFPSGRMKASAVLMQLISCGSISFKDCGATSMEGQEFSVCKSRVPRGDGKEGAGTSTGIVGFSGVRLEDKEYFSGSLIETQKVKEAPMALKRSSSYNADRGSQMQLSEKEIDQGRRAKCIPRKHKGTSQATKKESNSMITSSSSNSEHGSKRIDNEQTMRDLRDRLDIHL